MCGPQGDYTGLFLLQLILLNSCSWALALLLTLNSVEITLTEGRLTQYLNTMSEIAANPDKDNNLWVPWHLPWQESA